MPHMYSHADRGWKEYWKLLGLVGSIFMSLAVLLAAVSTAGYAIYVSNVEGIHHRSPGHSWACVLLWLPLAIQLLVAYRLQQKKRITLFSTEGQFRRYFNFYFSRMALCLTAYTALWLCYVITFYFALAPPTIWWLSWIPLIAIVALLALIVHATYLITKTSFHDDKYLLHVDAVQLRYGEVCSTLEKGAKPEVEKIKEWLRKDPDCKVHRTAVWNIVADLDVGHLVAALNRLIRSRDFYLATHKFNDGDDPDGFLDLLPDQIEEHNRSYINAALPQLKGKNQENGNQGDDKSNGRREKHRRIQQRLLKQKEQRDGIAMFPFFTMVFFFSIFLCIAYLFAFAFAFEDRYVQRIDLKGRGALLMSDEQHVDVGQFPVERPSPSPRVDKLIDRQKIFYFISGGAGITTESKANMDTRLKHIARINSNSLESLVDSIKQVLGSHPVRVLLVGRADDYAVGNSYGSNFEISSARVKNVRYLINERLIADGLLPERLTEIEWAESPFSNDRTLTPRVGNPRESSKLALVLNNEDGARNSSVQPIPQDFKNTLKRESYDSGRKDWKDDLRDSLERLAAISNKPIPFENAQKILDDIHKWDGARTAGNVPEAEKLADDIDAELYEIEDPPGRKRAVEVYLYDKEIPTPDSNPAPESKRMALLDYLYFSLYTITTTGYGDVKPETPYAKFLCGAANLTEFFFIVVFFNTLLSLKRKDGQPNAF